MATKIQHGGYGAIATILDQTGSAPNTLASLGSTSKAISAAIDNSAEATARFLFDDLELVTTWGSNPTTFSVNVYLIPSADDTNYADGSDSVAVPQASYVGVFEPRAVTTAQRMVIRDVPIPPGLYKYVIENRTGQAFPSNATTSTFKRRPHSLATV